MINIKTKLLIIVMSVVLFVNTYDLRVFANTDYDHNELLDYPGYGEAMYESIVEQTTFISGRYTENKEYVNQSINSITDYAKTWWNEYERISNMPPKEKLREMLNAAGGYALTVGDFIKNLFTDYDEHANYVPPMATDYSAFAQAFTLSASSTIAVANGWSVTLVGSHGSKLLSTGNKLSASFSGSGGILTKTVYVSGNVTHRVSEPGDYYALQDAYMNYPYSSSIAKVINQIYLMGASLIIVKNSTNEQIELPIIDRTHDDNIKIINQYLNDGTEKSIVTPQPKAYLSCPDGTRIDMAINGGTFLDINGQVMQVSKDGVATIDGLLCNLGWEKPTVKYIDGTGQVGISTPDGKTIDAETGERIFEDGEIDDSLEGCDGVLCAIGKLLSGLGSIAKAIAAIPLKILDGLLELIKKILIPEENFWDSNLGELKDKFFHDEVKEVQQGIEGLTSAGGGQFGDVTGSLMGVDNLKIIDSSSINMSLDTLHSWVRGFFYPLLLFFNINQMYRVIRGTSLVGIGGKKDE